MGTNPTPPIQELGSSCPEDCDHDGLCADYRAAITQAEREAEAAWLRAAEASTPESDRELREHAAIYGEGFGA